MPKTPLLTVDAVILDPTHGVVLVRRANPPFAGSWALPGGFVEVGETCEAACAREAAEETGLEVRVVSLVGVFSEPGRDPRGHTVSVAYLCRPVRGELAAASDAADARWFSDVEGVDLAFDHREILAALHLSSEG